ncbi:MAG: IS110 family transposase [Planctomycetota bacterium]
MEFTRIARSDVVCFVGIDIRKDTLTACVGAAKDREPSFERRARKSRERTCEFLASEIEQDQAQSERRISELRRAPEFDGLRTILESLPGVGLMTATTAIAEIGAFCRYVILVSMVYASGKSSWLGHISKTGAPDLRRGLQQAIWTAIRCDGGFKKT